MPGIDCYTCHVCRTKCRDSYDVAKVSTKKEKRRITEYAYFLASCSDPKSLKEFKTIAKNWISVLSTLPVGGLEMVSEQRLRELYAIHEKGLIKDTLHERTGGRGQKAGSDSPQVPTNSPKENEPAEKEEENMNKSQQAVEEKDLEKIMMTMSPDESKIVKAFIAAYKIHYPSGRMQEEKYIKPGNVFKDTTRNLQYQAYREGYLNALAPVNISSDFGGKLKKLAKALEREDRAKIALDKAITEADATSAEFTASIKAVAETT